MSYNAIVEEKNKQIRERYELAMERMEGIVCDQHTLPEQYRDFFKKTAKFLLQVKDIATMMEAGEWEEVGFDEWKEINYDLYEDIFPKKKKRK